MDSAYNAYCRLCAELKPSSKLINLLSNHTQCEEIAKKLTRLNVGATLEDPRQDVLPKTVCLLCAASLDRAFQFIVGVEHAQGVLNNLILTQKIKKESRESSLEENFTYEYEPPEDIKDVVKDESCAEDFKCSENSQKQGMKLKKRRGNKLKNSDSSIEVTLNSDEEHVTNDPAEDFKQEPETKKGEQVKTRGGKNLKTNSSTKSFEVDAIPLSQLNLTWTDYSWKCCLCETQFPNIDELKIHSMQQHLRCNTFGCLDCRSRKSVLDRFLSHIRQHREYLKLSCYKCHTKFSTPREANAHKSVHKNSKYICRGCNTPFLNQEDWKVHTKLYYNANRTQFITEEQSITNNFTCTICQKTLKGKNSLKVHLLIHTDRKRDHTCDKCGKCFWNKEILAGHMVLHDNLKFKCEICKATFKSRIQLYNHVGVHDKKKPFACKQCGRCFRLQRQLTAHSIIHTDMLPHSCSYCDKRFRFKCVLLTHLHQHTGVKPYSCDLCQHRFTNWPNYNKHMKGRHGMDMSKTKRTPDGIFHVDKATGSVIIPTETKESIAWKEKMRQRRLVRSKANAKKNDDTSMET